MSYQIFARKYRPQTFDEMIGQKAVVQTLKNAIRMNRVAQAYLFSGMRGVGKTSAARILAKALNCKEGPTPTPCNVCEFCLAINEDRSVDVIEIDGASNRGIDDVRALRDAVKYRPIQNRTKVYIIDEVHMLTREAFNALLKTLEEPPPRTVFIFATTEFTRVPATIVSRSQHFEFKKIPYVDIVKHLLKIAKAENLLVSDRGLNMIAEAADGSMRDAQSLLDQAVAFSGTQVRDEDLKEILGAMSRDLLFAFSTAILDQNAGAIFPLVEQVVNQGYDLRFLAKELIQHFRNLLLVKSVRAPQDLLALSDDDIKRLQSEAERASAEDFLRYLNALQAGEPGLRFSSHPQITLESMLVKLCHYPSLIPLKDLISEVERLRPAGGSAEPRAPKTPPPPPPSSAPPRTAPPRSTKTASEPPPAAPEEAPAAVRPEAPKNILPRMIEILQREKSSLAAILMQYSSHRFEDEPYDAKFLPEKRFVMTSPLVLRIVFPRGRAELLEALEKEARLIERAASEAAGQKVQVRFAEEAGAKSRTSEMDLALKDSNVQHFMDTFRARPLSVERITRSENNEE